MPQPRFGITGRWDLLPRVIPVDRSEDPWVRQIRVFRTPALTVVVHRFYHPDPYPDPHDHPWTFASFVLRGGYSEVVYTNPEDLTEWHVRTHRRWSWHRMTPDTSHRIVTADRAMTLMLCGRWVRRSIRFWVADGAEPVEGFAYSVRRGA